MKDKSGQTVTWRGTVDETTHENSFDPGIWSKHGTRVEKKDFRKWLEERLVSHFFVGKRGIRLVYSERKEFEEFIS